MRLCSVWPGRPSALSNHHTVERDEPGGAARISLGHPEEDRDGTPEPQWGQPACTMALSRFLSGWVRDWDTGGTYTDTRICPACHGARLRPEYALVTLAGATVQQVNELPLVQLADLMMRVDSTAGPADRRGETVTARSGDRAQAIALLAVGGVELSALKFAMRRRFPPVKRSASSSRGCWVAG